MDITTDFLIRLESTAAGGIPPGETDDAVTPVNPMRRGRIRYWTAEVIDPLYGNAAAVHEALLARIGVKIRIAGKPLAGTGANDFVPLRSLIGVPGSRTPFNIAVTRDTEIEAEFVSFDASASAAPDLKVILLAHCQNDTRDEE